MTIELSENVINAIADAVVKKIKEPKTGHWIVYDVVKFGEFIGTEKYECSECHARVGAFTSNFCSNCGAKMEGEE